MEKLQFDSGVRSYRINGGAVLRFNPGDPNVYARFLEALEKLKTVEAELAESARGMDEGGEAVIRLLQDADRRLKALLSWVFGVGNDFEAILGGVNLLAVAENGERVVTNLFAALEPVLTEGAERCAKHAAAAAREKAAERRARQ